MRNLSNNDKQHEESWFVYLAECADKTLYCGITNNLITRFKQHNGLLKGGAKYTASRRPVTLLAYCLRKSKSIALKTEYTIKQLPKSKKLSFLQQIQNDGTKT